MSAFLGAAGHAEDRVNVVERHHPLEEKRFRKFSRFGVENRAAAKSTPCTVIKRSLTA
jgi:hypothetical protein